MNTSLTLTETGSAAINITNSIFYTELFNDYKNVNCSKDESFSANSAMKIIKGSCSTLFCACSSLPVGELVCGCGAEAR